jgi:hypothetical protein
MRRYIELCSRFPREKWLLTGETRKSALSDAAAVFRKRREESLLDAAAATGAVWAVFEADRIKWNAVTPQMREAYDLAFPNKPFESIADLRPEQIPGFVSAWKGKYFEVIVRDRLNAGGQVGGLALGEGQTARLADSPTQAGWDLEIVSESGESLTTYQLKATESLSYVRGALERYPEIEIIGTDEVQAASLSSGIRNEDLQSDVTAPLAALVDSPFEELIEAVLPGAPFVLIGAQAARPIMLKRSTMMREIPRLVERSVKSGAAIGAGALAALSGVLYLSLPAAFAARLGMDRVFTRRRLTDAVERSVEELRALRL